MPALDCLRRHLDRGEIARRAQLGRGPVTDFADHRDRLIGADVGSIALRQIDFGDFFDPAEIDRFDLEPDPRKVRAGERARRSLNLAGVDRNRRALLFQRAVADPALDLLAGWR